MTVVTIIYVYSLAKIHIPKAVNQIMTAYEEFMEKLSTIIEHAKTLNLTRLMNPTNKDKIWNSIKNNQAIPEFVYPDIPENVEQISQELKNLRIPDFPLKKLYEKKIASLQQNIYMLKNRENSDIILQESISRYGDVDSSLYDLAVSIVNNIKPSQEKATISAAKVKKHLQEQSSQLGVSNVTIRYDNTKWQTSVNPLKMELTLNSKRKFTQSEYERLPVHEVGTHFVRGYNALQQKDSLLRGMPNYLATEEGLAVVSELISGNLDTDSLRKYAGRVIGAKKVIEGNSFIQTINSLESFSFDKKHAFDIAFRLHRGGKYVKDQIYLKGCQDIINYANNGGKLSTLFVGKVGLGDLPLIQELQEQGHIQPPAIIPKYIQEFDESPYNISLL